LFYATPIHLGGLGLDPPNIAIFMGVFGIAQGLLQVSLSPRLVRHFGPKHVFLFAVASGGPVFIMFPVLNLLARKYGMAPVVVCIVLVQLMVILLFDMVISLLYGY
jgi:hypothetical protein